MATRKAITLWDAATDPPGRVVPAGVVVDVVDGSERNSASLGVVVSVTLPDGTVTGLSPQGLGPLPTGAAPAGSSVGLGVPLTGAGRFAARGRGEGSIDLTIGRYEPMMPGSQPPAMPASGPKISPLMIGAGILLLVLVLK